MRAHQCSLEGCLWPWCDRAEDKVDIHGTRELSLEMIVVVSLGRGDNDLWQHSGDREDVMDFLKGTSMLMIICLDVEDKIGDSQSESQVPTSAGQW